MPDAFFFNVPTRDLIIALASRNGVPTIYFDRPFVESGGLIAYGADFSEELRQAAGNFRMSARLNQLLGEGQEPGSVNGSLGAASE
jgi:hypothetical protein